MKNNLGKLIYLGSVALCLIWISGLVSCIPKRLTIDVDSPGIHHSLKVKFKVKNTLGRQNGKILMKYDARRAKILFLNPLNQVYFKLLVEGDRSVLINTKKKLFWQGNFKYLLMEMWKIDLGFSEFKRLIEEGVVPRQGLEKNGLQYFLKRDDQTGRLTKLDMFNDDISIQLKILSRKTKNGSIEFLDSRPAMRQGELEDVIDVVE